MAFIDLIGFLAGATVAISLVPQVLKSWKTKSTKDISLAWTLIYILGLTL
jgi:MtN3 and saliva related transmembrane protein